MPPIPQRWTVKLYPPWTADAGSPIREFILEQNQEDRARIVSRMQQLADLGPQRLLMEDHAELVRQARERLYELRVRGKHSFRLFFCYAHTTIVILHIIKKKGWDLPKQDIQTAERRCREVLRYDEERE